MGRVNAHSPTAAAAPPSASLQHFTHPHDLHPLSLYNPQTFCSGCKLQSSGIMYICKPCNFTLHESCAKLLQFITHPSHAGCTLSLLTVSSYPSGIFSCKACSGHGDSWNYHCDRCKYDLHVSCASKPLKIRIQAHRSCELGLIFKNPYLNSDSFCNICQQIGPKQWFYHCNSCEFDVHLDCTKVPQPTLQHQHSAPAAAPRTMHHNQLMHSTSSNGINVNDQFQAPAAQFNGFVGPPPQQPHLTHSANIGAIGNPHGANMYYQGPVNTGQTYGSLAGNLMMAPMQGFVGPPRPRPHLTHIASTGSIGNPFGANMYHQRPINTGQTHGSLMGNLMMSAIQGFVEGVFLGQEVTYGGGDNYGGDGYGGDAYGGDGYGGDANGGDGYGGDGYGGDGYGGDGGDGDVYSY